MASNEEAINDQIDLLQSLPTDESVERADALWRQVMVYKAFAETELSEAKAKRAQAEVARERAELDTAETTRRLCVGMKAEAEEGLREAESLKAEASRVLRQAEDARDEAREDARAAREARDRTTSEAKQRAEKILEEARAASRQESAELRNQALKEIKAIMGRVETVRAAADEELETQRILTNIAKLKADSAALLFQTSQQQPSMGNGLLDEPAPPTPQEGVAEDDMSREPQPPVPAAVSTNGDAHAAGADAAQETKAKGVANKGKSRKPNSS